MLYFTATNATPPRLCRRSLNIPQLYIYLPTDQLCFLTISLRTHNDHTEIQTTSKEHHHGGLVCVQQLGARPANRAGNSFELVRACSQILKVPTDSDQQGGHCIKPRNLRPHSLKDGPAKRGDALTQEAHRQQEPKCPTRNPQCQPAPSIL